MMYNDVKRSQEYWEQTTKDQRRKKNQGLIVAVLTLRMLLARRLLAENFWHVLMFNEWQNHWKKSHRSWRASFRASSCSLGFGFASDMACRLHSYQVPKGTWMHIPVVKNTYNIYAEKPEVALAWQWKVTQFLIFPRNSISYPIGYTS